MTSWRTDKRTTAERGYGGRWQRLSKQFLRQPENVLCEWRNIPRTSVRNICIKLEMSLKHEPSSSNPERACRSHWSRAYGWKFVWCKVPYMARRLIHPDVIEEIAARPVSAAGFDARDQTIALRYGRGESFAGLAQEYGLSRSRVAGIYSSEARDARRRIAVRWIDTLLDKRP